MKIIWFYLCILIDILPLLICVETEVPDEKKCSSNFSPYRITTSFGPKVICAYISTEKLTWEEGKSHCNLLFAQFTQQIHFKSSLRIDLLNKGIDTLWMGIRRRNNFFVTDYPSKLFREADSFSPDYWGYHWSDNEPGVNDCVALNISSGTLHTRNCNDTVHVVCDDGGKDISSIYESLACPEGWNLSFALSSSGRKCVSIQKARTHENAEEICLKNNGRLATFKEYNILSTSKFFSTLKTEDFWMKKRNSKLCEIARNVNGHFKNTLPASCTYKYPFACIKYFKIPSIKVHLSPKSVQPMQSDFKNATDLLTCDLETDNSDIDIENDVWFQWYKNGLPVPVNSYVLRLSYIGDALKRDPYIWDIASRQGYYHCEVQLPGSKETYFSQKMKFIYTDIATYVVEIHGIKQINNLDYSHQKFFEYMDEFDEASMSTVIQKMKIRYPEVEWDFISKSIVNEKAIMKIIVYVYKTEVEDFDERVTCEELKEAFEELNSVPVFMENMVVQINCEEYPIRNGFVQVIKNLRHIENKLNRMEDRQEYILKKLQGCDKSRNAESTRNNYDFDSTLFLEAVEDLKRLKNEIIHKASKHANSEDEHDGHERNELEDKIFPVSGEGSVLFGAANKLNRPEIIRPHFNPRESVEGLEDYSIQYSDEEEEDIRPNKLIFRKDL